MRLHSRNSLTFIATATLAFLTGCGNKPPQPTAPGQSPAAAADPSALLSPSENLALGARPVTSSNAQPFPVANLNDGSPEAWGSAETSDDTYAAIVLASTQLVKEFRLQLFTPDTPPRAHMHDIRVIAADSDSPKPEWKFIRGRLSTKVPFSEKITVPVLPDGTVVRIELDPSDPNFGPHKIWGFGCFSATRGDLRNYLSIGAGIYVRELQMK